MSSVAKETWERMGREEWLAFKRFVWAVGMENAPGVLGIGEETFESVWVRDVLAPRTLKKVRGAVAGWKEQSDALA